MSATATGSIDSVLLFNGTGEETIHIAEMPIAQITVPRFQRDRIPRHIEKVAADWDLTAFAFPMIAAFKGSYICLDGQQRLAACEIRGEEIVHVLLVEGISTPERLADLFLKINRDRKLLTAFQKFVGALEAKDPGTVAISKLLAEYNLTLGKSASQWGSVPAGAVVNIFDRGGRETLERVLRVKEQAWGATPSREANEGKTLLGLAVFVGRYYEKIDDDRLINTLKKLHPGYILTKTSTRDKPVSYPDFLRDEYNKGLRGKAKL